jgi:hypothetical protein
VPQAVELPPGASPVIPAATIQEQWNHVLGAMYKHNKSSPAVMQNFRVQRVDGSTVYLATENAMLYERINPYPEKKKVVESALYDVFKVPLRVQVIYQGTDGSLSSTGGDLPVPDDPLLSQAVQRGGRIKNSHE